MAFRNKRTGRRAGRQNDRETKRRTDEQTNRRADRQTDRHTYAGKCVHFRCQCQRCAPLSQQGADESEGREAWQALNSRKQKRISSVITCRCRLMKTRDPVKTEKEIPRERERDKQIGALIQVLPLATLAQRTS